MFVLCLCSVWENGYIIHLSDAISGASLQNVTVTIGRAMLRTSYEGFVTYASFDWDIRIIIPASPEYLEYKETVGTGLSRIQIQPKKLRPIGQTIKIVDSKTKQPHNISGNVSVNGIHVGHWGTTLTGQIKLYRDQAKIGDAFTITTNGNHLFKKQVYHLVLQESNVVELFRRENIMFNVTVCDAIIEFHVCGISVDSPSIVIPTVHGVQWKPIQVRQGKVKIPISNVWIGDTIKFSGQAKGFKAGEAEFVISDDKLPHVEILLQRLTNDDEIEMI